MKRFFAIVCAFIIVCSFAYADEMTTFIFPLFSVSIPNHYMFYVNDNVISIDGNYDYTMGNNMHRLADFLDVDDEIFLEAVDFEDFNDIIIRCDEISDANRDYRSLMDKDDLLLETLASDAGKQLSQDGFNVLSSSFYRTGNTIFCVAEGFASEQDMYFTIYGTQAKIGDKCYSIVISGTSHTTKKCDALADELVVIADSLIIDSSDLSSEAVQNNVSSNINTNTILCAVNGNLLTFGDIEPYITSLKSMYIAEYGYDENDPGLVDYCNRAGMYLAQQYLILDEIGHEFGVTFTKKEQELIHKQALSTWNEIVAYYEEAYYGVSESSDKDELLAACKGTLNLLESMGYTEESYIESEVLNTKYDKIIDAATKITITESELDEYIASIVEADKEKYNDDISAYEMMQYQGNPVYYRPDGYRAVIHILLLVDDQLLETYNNLTERLSSIQNGSVSSDDEDLVTMLLNATCQNILASVQPTIDEIMEKFNSGTSFANLVTEYGNDPGMLQEGALETGYEVAATSMLWDIPFRDAAMSIDHVGGVSDPVVGSYGVHIVYYLRDLAGGPILDAEIVNQLFEELLHQRQNEKLDQMINDRLSSATILYTNGAAPYIPEGFTQESLSITMAR